MTQDYDEYYDTKVSRSYGNSKMGLILGVPLIIIGLLDIAFTLTDLFVSNYNQAGTQRNPVLVYTWDENPFWPTYAKGFWVGLIVSRIRQKSLCLLLI